MNLVQDKVKQRNITPNFLRFRSTLALIKEKIRPALLEKRQLRTIRHKHKWPLSVQRGVPPVLVDAALKPTNAGCFTLANSVPLFLLRTAHQSQRNCLQGREWGACAEKKSHYDGRTTCNHALDQFKLKSYSHRTKYYCNWRQLSSKNTNW